MTGRVARRAGVFLALVLVMFLANELWPTGPDDPAPRPPLCVIDMKGQQREPAQGSGC